MSVLALIVTAGEIPFILEHPTFEGSVEDGHEFYGHSDALVVTVPHEGGKRATCFKHHHHQQPIQCTLVGAEVHATESELPPSLKEIEAAYTPDGWRVYTMEQAAVPYGRALKLFFESDS